MRHIFSLLLLIVSFSCMASPSSAPASSSADDGDKVPANAFFAEVPSSLSFAGEEVPLHYPDIKEALQREISVTMYMHSSTLRTLRAMKRYFAVIEPILKEAGVPEDFKYLAMAESGMNPEAISHAGAAGLWQFMKSAAKDHKIETGDNTDMRYDVETSTRAAAKYLKNSYKRFGNWTMAAASYNLGPAGVSRRMKTQGVDNYYDLYLPQETMRYVHRILALKIVSENPEKYGFIFTEEDYLKPFENYKTVTISESEIKWSEIAKRYGTNYKILRLLNPWIRSYEYSNKGNTEYKVKVPNSDFREKGY